MIETTYYLSYALCLNILGKNARLEPNTDPRTKNKINKAKGSMIKSFYRLSILFFGLLFQHSTNTCSFLLPDGQSYILLDVKFI